MQKSPYHKHLMESAADAATLNNATAAKQMAVVLK